MSQTDVYKKLFNERFKPETDKEIVYCSIILQLSEALEKQTRQNTETTKAVKYLAKVVASMRATAPAETEDTVSEEQAAAPAATEEAHGPRDQTPFPAGVPVSATADATGPVVETAPEIPVPDAGSGPVLTPQNPQPIMTKAKTAPKNGAKAEA